MSQLVCLGHVKIDTPADLLPHSEQTDRHQFSAVIVMIALTFMMIVVILMRRSLPIFREVLAVISGE